MSNESESERNVGMVMFVFHVRGHRNAVPTAQMKGKLRKYERDEMPNAFERKKSIANGV